MFIDGSNIILMKIYISIQIDRSIEENLVIFHALIIVDALFMFHTKHSLLQTQCSFLRQNKTNKALCHVQGWHSCASARHRPFIFSLDAQVST